jgi:hypothetical protein
MRLIRLNLTLRRAAALLILVAAGCGGGADKWSKKRPAVHQVSGTVLLDGAPIAGANVNFVPSGGTTAAYALTDEKGNFRLSTFAQADGAPSGKYRVTVQKTVQETAPDPMGGDNPPVVVKETSLVPEKYSDPETSGLLAEVGDKGSKGLVFELKR